MRLLVVVATLLLTSLAQAQTTTTTTLPPCSVPYLLSTPSQDCAIVGGKIYATSSTTTTTVTTTSTTVATTSTTTTTLVTTTSTSTTTTTTLGGSTTTTLAPWVLKFGGTDFDGIASYYGGRAVARDASNNLYVVGQFRVSATICSNAYTSRGLADGFLVKLTPQGTCLWSKQIGGTGDDNLLGVAVDTDGSVVTTGVFGGTMDPGGGAMIASGTYDGFLAKYDSTGAFQWQRQFGSTSGFDMGESVAIDSAHNVILAARVSGAVNFGGANLDNGAPSVPRFALAKYTSTNTHLWSTIFSATGISEIYDVAVDSANNVAIAGKFSNTINLGGGTLTSLNTKYDAFVASLNGSDATQRWAFDVGSTTADDEAYTVTIGPSDSICAGGYFTGTADLGFGNVTSFNADGWIRCSANADGSPLTAKQISGSGNEYVRGLHYAASTGMLWACGSADGPATDWGTGNLPQVGNTDSITAKYSAPNTTLTAQGARRYGSTLTDVAGDIVTMTTGNPVAVGYFNGTLNSPGDGSVITTGQNDGYVSAQAP